MKFNTKQMEIIKSHLSNHLQRHCPACDHPHFKVHDEACRLPKLLPLPPDAQRMMVLVVLECKACHHLSFYPCGSLGVNPRELIEKGAPLDQFDKMH